MPIDFSVLNKAPPWQKYLEQNSDSADKTLDRNQQEQQSQRQFSVQNDQNYNQSVQNQNTKDFNTGQLANMSAETGVKQQLANQSGTYQTGLLQQGQQDLGLRNQERVDLKDYRGQELGQRASEQADLKDYHNQDIAVQNRGLDITDKNNQGRLELDNKRFNMDNSKNLFDQSIALRDQTIKEQNQANTQLTFDKNQEYLQKQANAKTEEEKQQNALDYNQLDDAVKLSSMAREAKGIASQKGSDALAIGTMGLLTEISKVKNPVLQSQMIEQHLRSAAKIAVASGDEKGQAILEAATKIPNLTDRLMFLANQSAYAAKQAGLAMQNPSGNPGGYGAAQVNLGDNNPYNYQNTLSPDQAASRMLAPPTMTQKEYDKSGELLQARDDAKLQQAQAKADQATTLADLQRKMYQTARQADDASSTFAPPPGVDYKSVGLPRVGGDDFGVDISGAPGNLTQYIGKQLGKPGNQAYLDQMRQLQQQIGVAKAGQIDSKDPKASKILKDSIAGTPSVETSSEEHGKLALMARQQANDAQAYNSTMQAWRAQGRPLTGFDTYWAGEQAKRDVINQNEIKNMEKSQQESSPSNPSDGGGYGDLGAYLAAKQQGSSGRSDGSLK